MKMLYVELKQEAMVSCFLKSGKKLTFQKGLTKISAEEAEELEDIPMMAKLIEDEVLVGRPEIGCIENREPKSEVESKEDEPPAPPVKSDEGDGSSEESGEGDGDSDGDDTDSDKE